MTERARMTAEEVAEKERRLKILDEEIARLKAHRLSWPIAIFALSLLLGLLALRW